MAGENYFCNHILKLKEGTAGAAYFLLKRSDINPFSFARGKWMLKVEAYVDRSKGKGFETADDTKWFGSGLILLECKRSFQQKEKTAPRFLGLVDIAPYYYRSAVKPTKVILNSEYVEIDNPSDSDLEIYLKTIRGHSVPLKAASFDVNNYFLLVSLKQVKQ